jgi:hypothetical protein
MQSLHQMLAPTGVENSARERNPAKNLDLRAAV